MHLDPTFYRSLLKLKQQQHGIEALDLNFTITTSEFSTVSTKELKPHGQNIPVTDANKNEYIKLTARFKLVTQCEQQYAALKRGFHRTYLELDVFELLTNRIRAHPGRMGGNVCAC